MHATKQQLSLLDRLKKRSDFLRIQRAGNKWVAKGVILQAAPVTGQDGAGRISFGLTVSRRVSPSAVVRNRIRRRLRAAARDVLPQYSITNIEYVLIGRPETATRPYAELCNDLRWCLRKMGLEAAPAGEGDA